MGTPGEKAPVPSQHDLLETKTLLALLFRFSSLGALELIPTNMPGCKDAGAAQRTVRPLQPLGDPKSSPPRRRCLSKQSRWGRLCTDVPGLAQVPHAPWAEDSPGEDRRGPFLPTARSWQAGEHGVKRRARKSQKIPGGTSYRNASGPRNTWLPQDHTALLERQPPSAA